MDEEQAGREERYESARREASEAHDVAGAAEDALMDAERLRDDASTSAAERHTAQDRVDQVDEEWRRRLEEADLATELRDRARDSFEAGRGDAGGDDAAGDDAAL
jgi:hypothetical protein